MHIALQSDIPLPVQRYGGTERLQYWLLKELVKRGHRATLIAPPQSRVEAIGARLIPWDGKTGWRRLLPKDVDVLHIFFPYREGDDFGVPTLSTIGGNASPGEKFHPNTVFVSESHAKNHSSKSFVYNGVDLDEYIAPPLGQAKNDWQEFLFLAKARWGVKNLRDCQRACVANRKTLHVGGGRVWSLRSSLKGYGMIDLPKKIDLLSRSSALLWPVRWPEPFGIAMIEAMLRGRPVIASTHGSAPEIVRNSDVGVLCRNFQEFSDAVEDKTHDYSPQKIRDYAAENFSSKKMALHYESLYQLLLEGRNLQAHAPKALFSESPETLLEF